MPAFKVPFTTHCRLQGSRAVMESAQSCRNTSHLQCHRSPSIGSLPLTNSPSLSLQLQKTQDLRVGRSPCPAFPGFHHWSPNIKKPSCSPKAGTIGHSTLRVNLRLDPPSRSTGVLTITWKHFLLVKACLFESDTRQTEPHRSKTFILVLFHTITVTKFLHFSSCSLTIQTPDPLLPPLPHMQIFP